MPDSHPEYLAKLAAQAAAFEEQIIGVETPKAEVMDTYHGLRTLGETMLQDIKDPVEGVAASMEAAKVLMRANVAIFHANRSNNVQPPLDEKEESKLRKEYEGFQQASEGTIHFSTPPSKPKGAKKAKMRGTGSEKDLPDTSQEKPTPTKALNTTQPKGGPTAKKQASQKSAAKSEGVKKAKASKKKAAKKGKSEGETETEK